MTCIFPSIQVVPQTAGVFWRRGLLPPGYIFVKYSCGSNEAPAGKPFDPTWRGRPGWTQQVICPLGGITVRAARVGKGEGGAKEIIFQRLLAPPPHLQNSLPLVSPLLVAPNRTGDGRRTFFQLADNLIRFDGGQGEVHENEKGDGREGGGIGGSFAIALFNIKLEKFKKI
jgi:hypothetical protein